MCYIICAKRNANLFFGGFYLSAEQIVQIVMYVLVGIASIASAVISYIKTGSWGKSTAAAAKSVDVQLNEINSNILRRLDSLESRVEEIEKNEGQLMTLVGEIEKREVP